MSWFHNFIFSSIGRKWMMAITGLFLIVFLLVHLGVNLTLLFGKEIFNEASHFMATNPLIFIMQFALAFGFIYHIYLGIVVTLQNYRARGKDRYAKNKWSAHTPFSSRMMVYSGALVFAFLALHLYDYFYKLKFTEIITETYTDYDLVVELFQNPIHTLLYVVSFIILGFHLNHAFQSSFQTTGLTSPKYTPLIKTLGVLYTWLISIGFMAIAVWLFFSS